MIHMYYEDQDNQIKIFATGKISVTKNVDHFPDDSNAKNADGLLTTIVMTLVMTMVMTMVMKMVMTMVLMILRTTSKDKQGWALCIPAG